MVNFKDQAQVCVKDFERIFSKRNCFAEVEGYLNLYGMTPVEKTTNDFWLLLDGASKAEQITFKDAAENTKHIHFITKANTNFSILNNLIEEVTHFLVKLTQSFSIVDGLVPGDGYKNCIPSSPFVSHLITNSTLSKDSQTSLCHHIRESLSKPGRKR